MPAETLSRMTPTTPQTKGHNSLLFSKGLSEEKSHKSHNSRLLQLAERSTTTTNPRKTGPNSSSPNHLLSFRNVISSPSKSATLQNTQNPSIFARRNTSIMSPSPNSGGEIKAQNQSVRQNPKLYTSFSSKSCSKLTKAFIRSDPLKTNIEHLVSPPAHKTPSPSHSPNSSSSSSTMTMNDVNVNLSNNSTSSTSSNGYNPNHDPSDQQGPGRGSLSNLISTPLKALHASFHDRSKLSSAFAPRTRLFSQRDKSSQNTLPPNGNHTQKIKDKSSKSSTSNRDKSPDFLEYFGSSSQFDPHSGTAQRLSPPGQGHPINGSSSALTSTSTSTRARNYSTPDILEDILNVDNETTYILPERGRRASEDFINRTNNSHAAVAVLRGKVPSSNTSQSPSKSQIGSPLSLLDGMPHVQSQIGGRNLTRDQNHQYNPNLNLNLGNLHTATNNYKQHPQYPPPAHSHNQDTISLQEISPPPHPNGMKMSTATPMKISSSAACRAQIITLMARSTNGTNNNNEDEEEFFDNATTSTSTGSVANNSNPTQHVVKTAGVSHLHSNHVQSPQPSLPPVTFSQPQQNPSGLNETTSSEESGSGGSRNSTTWINSNYATVNGHGLGYHDECDDNANGPPPPIPRRCSTTSTSSSKTSSLLVSPRCQHQRQPTIRPPPPPPPVPYQTELTSEPQSEIKSVNSRMRNKKRFYDTNLGRTGLFVDVGGQDANHRGYNEQRVSNCHHQHQHEEGDFSETDKMGLIPSGKVKNIDEFYGKCVNGKEGGKLSSGKNNKRFSLMHSFSFRTADEKSTSGNGCGTGGDSNYAPLVNEDKLGMGRNRSRSLPKSFMSRKKKGPTVLQSLWIRDDHSFETLLEEKRSPESPSSSPSSHEDSDPANKMRWQKSVASSNSSSSSTAGEGQGRPKSFDYSQRKAWMKYYRDMEISSVTPNGVGGGPSSSSSSKSGHPSQRINKGSISHLHLLPELGVAEPSTSVKVHGHPNPQAEMGIPRRTLDSLGMTPSLFQRFSKTFSLRFGSSSSVNKVGGGGQGQSQGKKVNKGSSSVGLGVGSSPDLHARFQDGDAQSGKMRKGKSKSIRGEKCQSGDSGIGIDDPHPSSRLRRIRSEFIETSAHLHHPEQFQNGSTTGVGLPCRNSCSILTNNGSSSSSCAALGKMSLVEIPNHVWEEENKERTRQIQRKNGGLTTTSYEDILESKLDGDEDDGFSSGEDSGSRTSDPSLPSHTSESDPSTCVLDERRENPASGAPSHHYHSLPHKNSRKDKQQQQGLLLGMNGNRGGGDPNSHPMNLSPSGRSKSLEDDQAKDGNAVTSVEDNSIRGKVIREIILTEQNYVKTLNDIVQGFLNPCRARIDLFSEENVRNIFSNVEDILRLHARFLEAMKERIHPTSISASNIGQIFTEWADHFNLYSEYCCNNPISMTTVRSLMLNQEYAEFFEACRRLQLMDKLPLHGFLLRPIQRICQYHLQLAELLKQTEASHSDYLTVVQAVDTMKTVAMKINDTQKQFDSLQEIIRIQNSIDGWEGPDLLNRNSTLLTKGDLVKSTHGKRNKDIFCFLFNKDLVFCKKDYVKKGGYVFDGRVDLEVGVWLNIDSNEEDEYFGMVHNSWRIYSHDQKTWILFTAPTPTDKRRWISSLEKAAEIQAADPRMCTMAKLTTLLSDEQARPQSQHYSSSSNTLPKSNKKSKGKHAAVNNGKIDAEAMLIEVSKLKRPNYIQQPSHLHKDNNRGSKFYV